MFGNSRSGRGGDERGGGRDVERVRVVAAGAGRVDEIVALGMHRQYVLAHRLGAAGDLVGSLALCAERDEEAADLRWRRLAAHDLAHHLARLGTGEVVAVQQSRNRLLDHAVRKLRSRSRPCGVSTDSGWNCTPSTGSSRWRTAITSSSPRADTSRHSGIAVAASE